VRNGTKSLPVNSQPYPQGSREQRVRHQKGTKSGASGYENAGLLLPCKRVNIPHQSRAGKWGEGQEEVIEDTLRERRRKQQKGPGKQQNRREEFSTGGKEQKFVPPKCKEKRGKKAGEQFRRGP